MTETKQPPLEVASQISSLSIMTQATQKQLQAALLILESISDPSLTFKEEQEIYCLQANLKELIEPRLPINLAGKSKEILNKLEALEAEI